MKRFLSYFASMLIVLAVTDLYTGGALLEFGERRPEKLSAMLNGADSFRDIIAEQQKTEEAGSDGLGELISAKSCAFVLAAFDRDKAGVEDMLYMGTEYLLTKDNAGYIRYTTEDLHVEGYMATDRKLLSVRQSWYVTGDDGTITSGVEVVIEGETAPQTWYIHYRKSFGEWKVFMLENGI